MKCIAIYRLDIKKIILESTDKHDIIYLLFVYWVVGENDGYQVIFE